MVHNMIHNNDGYGVVLVKPAIPSETKDASGQETTGTFLFLEETPKATKSSILRFLDCILHNFVFEICGCHEVHNQRAG